jgi:hypothetical protein
LFICPQGGVLIGADRDPAEDDSKRRIKQIDRKHPGSRFDADSRPGAREVIELPGAKVWFPEEYPEFVSEKLREHWSRGGPNGGA